MLNKELIDEYRKWTELERNLEIKNKAYKNDQFIDRLNMLEDIINENNDQIKRDIVTMQSIKLNGFSIKALKNLLKNERIDTELFFMISENLRTNEGKIIDMIERMDDRTSKENPDVDGDILDQIMDTNLKTLSYHLIHDKNDYGDYEISTNPLSLLKALNDEKIIITIHFKDLIK